MKGVLCIAVVLLAGCGDWGPPTSNQCLRSELFKECMAAIPAGPVVIGNDNNWGEVIGKCENAAYYQSLRTRDHVPAACRGS